MPSEKKEIFFISDYRNMTWEPARYPSYWILKELDKDKRFKVYCTANTISDSDRNYFENIDFVELRYKGNVQIQKPMYNYAIYKAYKKVSDNVEIIHHREMFQVGKGYNLIPLLSNVLDKTFIIGPLEIPHNIFEDDMLAGLSGMSKYVNKFIYKNRNNLGYMFEMLFDKTVDKADIFIVPNMTTKKELTKHVDSNKIKIINFGVDMSIYGKYEYLANENNYDIIYGGSAIERKGVEYLLEAIPLVKKYFPDVKLHLMARGYKVEEYKRISKQLGISENVIFHGILDKDKYLTMLSNCRLLCLPTLSDSYAWTVLDAVCTGVPVVATTECKCDDLFDNGEIGIKVEPRSAEQLADAILKLFSDFELCKKFSENELKKRYKFDYETIIPTYIRLYEKNL